MSPEEERLRQRGEMIETSFHFWNEILTNCMETLESGDGYETPEEYRDSLEMEKELKYILSHIEFESREMEKHERDILAYLDEDEE